MIVPPSWNLPDAVRSRLSPTTFGRQRAILEEGHLLLVLHKPPGPDDTNREGVLFWRNPKAEWHISRGGAGPQGLKRHVQEYAEREAKLSETFENASDATTLFEVLAAVTPLARAAHNMHLALQTAREGLDDDPVLLEMRDLASDADRNLELLREEVDNAIQFRAAKDAEVQARLSKEMVRANHRLNILIALFLPITAIGSMFGMNLANGMDNRGPAFFWVVLILGILLGGALVSWVLQKPKG